MEDEQIVYEYDLETTMIMIMMADMGFTWYYYA